MSAGKPTSSPTPAEEARAAWEALFMAQRRVMRETEARLREASLPPIQWYDILYNLYRAPERRLRNHELAERVMMSPSGLTRAADRMEERGAVERAPCPGDRRGSLISLTDGGVELMREIWRHYGAVIAEHFGPAVAGRESTVREILESSSASIEAGSTPERG